MQKYNSIQEISKQLLCLGCGCCASICPKKSITLKKNNRTGLLEPRVDTETCINCQQCLKVCPGVGWDLNSLHPNNQSENNIPYLGNVECCYVGCSTNDEIRWNGHQEE